MVLSDLIDCGLAAWTNNPWTVITLIQIFPNSEWITRHLLCLAESGPFQTERQKSLMSSGQNCSNFGRNYLIIKAKVQRKYMGGSVHIWPYRVNHTIIKRASGLVLMFFPGSFSLYCNMICDSWKLVVKNYGSAMLWSVSKRVQPEWWGTQKPIAFF